MLAQKGKADLKKAPKRERAIGEVLSASSKDLAQGGGRPSPSGSGGSAGVGCEVLSASSSTLADLRKLFDEGVHTSEVLVLLLSEGLLTRPWYGRAAPQNLALCAFHASHASVMHV